jgi:dynein heavy chain
MIGDQFLKNIEGSIFKKTSQCHHKMKEYYYYWERRVYNALVKMIMRALISFKNLLMQQGST